MKRVDQDVAGRPLRGKPRAPETGRTIRSPLGMDVASFLDPNPPDAEIDEFIEFLGLGSADGDETGPGGAEFPDADPVFRERLRRRLWHVHHFMHTKRNGEPH